MTSLEPPSADRVPRQRRAEGPHFAWGKSLNLVGRDDEIAAMQEALDGALAGMTRSLVITGDPGQGKTALLDEAERRATGFRIVRVRGSESDRAFSYAGLLQALGPLQGRLAQVPKRQADALAFALGWSPQVVDSEPFLIAAATLSLLAAEAEHQPVAVLVDDAHLVDRESATALSFAARRMGEDPICFVWATRNEPTAADLLSGLPTVALAGLTGEAAADLVAERVTGRVEPRVAQQLAADTGGNPLGILEVATRLTDAQLLGSAPLPERLPVGDRLRTEYARLIAGLTQPSKFVLLLCALDNSGSVGSMRSTLATTDGWATNLDGLVDRGILVQDTTDVRFRHPLLRTAVLAMATSSQTRKAHLTLAQSRAERGDPRSAAWHRAEASLGPDPALAADLTAIASEDRRRKGYAAASAALERASSLTSDATEAAALLAAAAEDAFVAGDLERTRRVARSLLDRAQDPEVRGRALSTLGTLELVTGSVPLAAEMLTSAADGLSGTALIRTLADLGMAQFRLSEFDAIVVTAERMAAAADSEDPEQQMLTDFIGSIAAAAVGDLTTSRLRVEQVIARIADPPLRDDPRSLVYLALAAGFAGDVAPIFALGEHLLALARERGAFGVLVPSLALTAAGRAWVGDNAGAFADAGEAVELGMQLGYAVDVASACGTVAWQSAARGLHQEAVEAIDLGRTLTDRAGTTASAAHLAITEAFCALSRGDAERAIAVLEGRLAADGGIGSSGEPLGVAPDLVEAYVATGQRDRAVALAEQFADATPPEAPSLAHALVARTRGLAAQDDAESAQAFEDALRAHAEAIAPFETARTRLAYGVRLRRGGQRVLARIQLEQAREAFVAMDLTAWASRASDELAASGVRARKRELTATEPLTSQEVRAALHAARGLTNKEIAAALFLSPKTVERHLSSVYRKRGLRSRAELAAAFAEGTFGAE
ncbi:AAA family ATPase [Knoellia sp. S7-12]|uniref:helix-turn-helix transcriptional regulator n=1 Tax=Knoellia sp. S7-12 TaxID=3126698 RepID=UPI0033686F67